MNPSESAVACAARSLAASLVAASILAGCGAPDLPQSIPMDADDIAGSVTSVAGAEAGVWVIAETRDLPTRFAKIVVTDAQGRYLIPDLPPARYEVWVRGYGLASGWTSPRSSHPTRPPQPGCIRRRTGTPC
jgi:hypothetical protein